MSNNTNITGAVTDKLVEAFEFFNAELDTARQPRIHFDTQPWTSELLWMVLAGQVEGW